MRVPLPTLWGRHARACVGELSKSKTRSPRKVCRPASAEHLRLPAHHCKARGGNVGLRPLRPTKVACPSLPVAAPAG